MAKVLLVIGDAAEVLDTFYPLFRVQEAGHQVVVAGPAKRTYALVLHERPEGWDVTRESPGYHLAADVAFKDVKPEEYHGLVISGGRAPEYLRYDPDLMRVVRCSSTATCQSPASVTASRSSRRRACCAAGR